MVCVRKTGAVEFRAPRDPVASNHHCLLCMSCAGSFSDCARRCSPLRTPCIGSFADCADIAPASLLLLASPLCCFLPRLRLQPPASCYPLHPADSLPCCRVCRCCTAPALPLVAAPPASGSGPASAWAGSLPFPLPPLWASARPPRAPCPAPSGAATAPLTAGTASSMIAAMIVLGAAVPALAHLSAGFPCTESEQNRHAYVPR